MSMITLPSRPDERESSPGGPTVDDRDWLGAQLDPRGEYEEDDDLFGDDDDDDDDDDEIGELDGEELEDDEIEDEDFETEPEV
ncbi:MAG TPA: hypothetical protein VIJ33_07385 [Solirubrobacteraceae bacterium]